MKPNFSSIILGTVQLGMPYGIGRWKNELMPEKNAFAILDAAWEMGITTLDTSPNYGIAEERIAKYMRQNPNKEFHIISKIKEIGVHDADVDISFQNWQQSSSFKNFDNLTSLTLLLHNEKHIFREAIAEKLDKLKMMKQVSFWGVSVYENEVALSSEKIEGCSIVELPFGFLNQKFGKNGTIKKLSEAKKTTMARSVFTKGVLFKQPSSVKKLDVEYRNVLHQLKEFLDQSNSTLAHFGVRFALSEPGIDHVVVGFDSVKQLTELNLLVKNQSNHAIPETLARRARNLNGELSRPELWKLNPAVRTMIE